MWVREHHELHRLTRFAKVMLLKSLTHRYDFQSEARLSIQYRDLMVCSLALDPRFKHFPVQLCGLSRGEDYVWGVVKDAALRHIKFEKRSDEVPPPAPTRPRTGFFNALHEFIEEGPLMSSIADTDSDSTYELDVAIESYRKLPVLPQEADPLGFWRDNSASSLLRPLLPLAASVSAVPATETICGFSRQAAKY